MASHLHLNPSPGRSCGCRGLNSVLGNLGVVDSHPLTITGLAGGKVTVSGGDELEGLDIISGTIAISNLWPSPTAWVLILVAASTTAPAR